MQLIIDVVEIFKQYKYRKPFSYFWKTKISVHNKTKKSSIFYESLEKELGVENTEAKVSRHGKYIHHTWTLKLDSKFREKLNVFSKKHEEYLHLTQECYDVIDDKCDNPILN